MQCGFWVVEVYNQLLLDRDSYFIKYNYYPC